ncbi:hypothetical protein MUU74_01685 [Chryseobacterium daecheongense]|uniref:hypothetical protein n=1 Tax=Chryseobacterium daecheongense TaxID=192389 RepID=UPI001FD662BB|nr:hypothetical protein [Chryseobacterium daecheongense]UOU98678.1 hypothetical protein MUU74_01685 [Chryseobacterium daecheongense]
MASRTICPGCFLLISIEFDTFDKILFQKLVYTGKLISEKQQVSYFIKVVAFFWLATKIWSYKTWITDRIYPVIPPLDIVKNVPGFVHLFLFGFSLLALLVILFKESRLLLISLFLSEMLSCSLDTVRWQPWEYMYMCILLMTIINFHKPKNILLLTHLLLVSIYLFSGLHKFNRGFLSLVWMNMILIDFFGLSMDLILKYKLFFVGLLIPIVELVLAGLLLISKSKRRISYILILVHVIILIVIGPFGLQYNSVVWFWNLVMIGMLLIIYVKPIDPVTKSFCTSNFYWLVLWFVMPGFSFFGHWYQYFSFNLYSGKGEQLYFCFSEKKGELKPYFDPKMNTICLGKPCINLQNWALAEIKSAPLPETEIYRKIAVYMKQKYPNDSIKIISYDLQTQKRVEMK